MNYVNQDVNDKRGDTFIQNTTNCIFLQEGLLLNQTTFFDPTFRFVIKPRVPGCYVTSPFGSVYYV